MYERDLAKIVKNEFASPPTTQQYCGEPQKNSTSEYSDSNVITRKVEVIIIHMFRTDFFLNSISCFTSVIVSRYSPSINAICPVLYSLIALEILTPMKMKTVLISWLTLLGSMK